MNQVQFLLQANKTSSSHRDLLIEKVKALEENLKRVEDDNKVLKDINLSTKNLRGKLDELQIKNSELKIELELGKKYSRSLLNLLDLFKVRFEDYKTKLLRAQNDKTLKDENIRVLRILNNLGANRKKFLKKLF